MTGQGTAEITFDLAQLIPSESSVQLHQDMATSVTASNSSQKQTAAVKLDVNIHLESK
jgi:hypothetical protein